MACAALEAAVKPCVVPFNCAAAAWAMALAAWLSSPLTRYRRPRSTAKPMKPNSTGIRMAAIWIEMPPRSVLFLFGFWFLVTTRPHKLRGILSLFPFILLGSGQEGDREIRELRFLLRAQRFHK